MKFSFGCLLLCAMVALVYSTSCQNDDISSCTGMTCTGMDEVVGCDHDVCTCVLATTTPPPIGQQCTTMNDCPQHHGPHNHCHGHDATQHCVDGKCQCLH